MAWMKISKHKRRLLLAVLAVLVFCLPVYLLFTGWQTQVYSFNSPTGAVLHLEPMILAGLDNGISKILIKPEGRPVESVELLQTFFDQPIALIPLPDPGVFLVAYNFDVKDVFMIIDSRQPSDGKEASDKDLKFVIKSSSIQIRKATRAEIEDAVVCFSSLKAKERESAICPTLWLGISICKPSIDSIGNILAKGAASAQ